MDKCENKKSVIWGLSTFKLKSKYTVIFVDFVVCGFIKACHVDGANYSLAQFEHNWNKSVPMMTVPCRKEAINAIKKSLTSGKRSLKRREVKLGRGFSSPWPLLVKPAVQQTHRVWIRGGRGGGGLGWKWSTSETWPLENWPHEIIWIVL